MTLHLFVMYSHMRLQLPVSDSYVSQDLYNECACAYIFSVEYVYLVIEPLQYRDIKSYIAVLRCVQADNFDYYVLEPCIHRNQ